MIELEERIVVLEHEKLELQKAFEAKETQLPLPVQKPTPLAPKLMLLLILRTNILRSWLRYRSTSNWPKPELAKQRKNTASRRSSFVATGRPSVLALTTFGEKCHALCPRMV